MSETIIMKIFGFELNFKKSLSPVPARSGSWFSLIREGSAGAWQRSETVEVDTALTHSAVFACVSLIASDIAKMPIKFTRNSNGFWQEIAHRYAPLMRQPNAYQNRTQFIASWLSSKLLHGNAYILKVRDGAGFVRSLHLLDPRTVTPLVADSGDIFYRLSKSDLAGVGVNATVPAREIIHDRGFTPFHPLVGVSPLTAAGLAASQAIAIQRNSAVFFENGCRPGGTLSAPGTISKETAERLKQDWQEKYSGQNVGKVAVLGDGLKYEQLSVNAEDAQLIEQLNFTAQDVCRAFHVPAWKIGAGPAAPYTGVEAMNLAYYSDCLQCLIEALELCLDEGLNLPASERTEMDLDHLLRMDTLSRYEAYGKAIGAGWMKPNEARQREGLAPVDGGDTCYMQQQNFALAALTQRKPTEGGTQA